MEFKALIDKAINIRKQYEKKKSYGKAIFSAGAGLSNRDPKDVVSTDIKSFEGGGFKFAVAQVEVTDILQLTEHLDPLKHAPNDLPYPPTPDGTRDAQGVVSRKKQLLPAVLGLLER